ncbi:MAG: hypothetical protein KJ622_12670 [Alphaproteobacteria bacterium]|nr:hypothetical protein [Alphaproteobacteria bacterium]
MRAQLLLVLAIMTPWLVVRANAQSLDPHEIYEQKCSGCHEAHGGNFAMNSLDLVDGRIVGRKGSLELREILAAGHGRLAKPEIDAVLALFESVLASGQVFQKKCRICHDRAVVFARRNLIVRDGRLRGRYSGHDIGRFLEDHGRLEADELSRIVDMFRRQLD